MEVLLTLSDINKLDKVLICKPDGLIFGQDFSTRFNYSISDFEKINAFCLKNNFKRYLSIDAFINEEDKIDLINYLLYIKDKNFDGIYFSDLGIINLAKTLNIESKLIYDPDTLMTNSLDIAFYLKQGIDVVVARELEVEELFRIIKNNKYKLDMQVFGHLKLSNSKREFLTNYYKHLGIKKDIKNKKTIHIIFNIFFNT